MNTPFYSKWFWTKTEKMYTCASCKKTPNTNLIVIDIKGKQNLACSEDCFNSCINMFKTNTSDWHSASQKFTEERQLNDRASTN